MSFLDRCCSTLAAMAHHASELLCGMGNRRMPTKGLRADVQQAGFFEPDMAGSATIDRTDFRQPVLLDSAMKMPLQGDRVTTPAY